MEKMYQLELTEYDICTLLDAIEHLPKGNEWNFDNTQRDPAIKDLYKRLNKALKAIRR